MNGKEWNGNGYDKNGNIIYTLVNGKGNVKKYDENGQLKEEGEYLYGERFGLWKTYINGKLHKEAEYLDGKYNGKVKFYEDGVLKSVHNYVKGEISH